MNGTISPPRPCPPGTADALFAEARRRRRRRRVAGLAVFLTLATATAVAFVGIGSDRAPAARDAHRGIPGTAGTARADLAGSVAWVDYIGRLHLGDLVTGAQRVVARSKAYPAVPLVQ